MAVLACTLVAPIRNNATQLQRETQKRRPGEVVSHLYGRIIQKGTLPVASGCQWQPTSAERIADIIAPSPRPVKQSITPSHQLAVRYVPILTEHPHPGPLQYRRRLPWRDVP